MQKIFIAALICAAAFSSSTASAARPQPSGDGDKLIAIDIALEPDATMIEHAEAVNARLLSVFPKGFALDASHRPHITMLQRYVRTADLEKIYAAAGGILAGEEVTEWKLEASKLQGTPWGENGLVGIGVETTDDLLKLQQKLIEAVAPFTVETGTQDSFFTTPEDPEIELPIMDYVAGYVPNASGKNFNPHVTVGLGTKEFLAPLLAEPFETFTFSPAGAAVYQLGHYGTARAKLKEFDLKS